MVHLLGTLDGRSQRICIYKNMEYLLTSLPAAGRDVVVFAFFLVNKADAIIIALQAGSLCQRPAPV